MTLADILETSSSSDYYEEEAQEYLEDQGLRVQSHSREALYRKAWKAGWRPLPNKGHILHP